MSDILQEHNPWDKNGLWKHELRRVRDLHPNPKNPRTITEQSLKGLRESLKDNGYTMRLIVDSHNKILSGHARWIIMNQDDPDAVIEVLVAQRELTEQEEKDAILGHNVLGGSWDIESAQMNFDPIDWQKFDLTFDIDDLPGVEKQEQHGSLADKFLIMPASVLNSRDGKWQERKKMWLAINGDDARSRENLLGFSGLSDLNQGSSIFDPVLAEIICKWFLPTTGQCSICDPFAGGMFGYVASYLGHAFTGIELRQEQADINNDNIKDFPQSKYVCDDGQNIGKYILENSQDMLFSCPPYFDLEKYSNNPKDASAQKNYNDFITILENALSAGCKCLKNNRFAVIVMSNVRNHKGGAYYDICGDITKIMQNNGLSLYNEFILVNSIGSGRLRAAGYMRVRKNVRTHHEVLVFYKGNAPIKDIPQEFGDIDFLDFDDEEKE